jgi:Domain of unknown function (DUF5615)
MPGGAVRLLLDEMFAPAIVAALCDLDHDVLAVADRPDLRALTDEKIFANACADGRWLVTENVKDFRPILLRAIQEGSVTTGIVFTSSRTSPRSRKNPGPLISALHHWLTTSSPKPPVTEDWLAAVQ